MPRGHVDHLFSAAYDGEMSRDQEARFDAHLDGCERCTAAYADFTAGVDLVRGLPRARMPLKVHLPSTPPVAERRVIPRLHLGRLRLLPGGATAIAAVAAAAIVIVALGRSGTGTNSDSSKALLQPVAGDGRSAATSCAHPIAGAVSSQPPAGYDYVSNATDPTNRPNQRLVLATMTGDVSAGSSVVIFAQLTLPRTASVGNGAAPAAPAPAGIVPCVTVTASGRSLKFTAPQSPLPDAAPADAGSVTGTTGGALAGASPLVTFTVPPGVAPGTILYVVATIPPGYPDSADPPLTVDLQITVR